MNDRATAVPPPTRERAWLSPAGFLSGAGLLAAAFAGCALAGWREDTTFLSGTVGADGWEATRNGCAAYLLAYFGVVLVAPILVLAAGLLALWQALVHRATRVTGTGDFSKRP
jgi:hypothetical protein